MPTYEYQCSKCKKKYDYFQKITDKPLARCIHCKGKVERLIGAGGGLIFKGSGFYITDYRKPWPEAKEGKAPDAGKNPKESKPGKGG